MSSSRRVFAAHLCDIEAQGQHALQTTLPGTISRACAHDAPGVSRELERTTTNARSAPAKDVAQAAAGGNGVGRQSSSGAAAPPEGLKARIQGLVQSLRAVTEVRMRHSGQILPRAVCHMTE